MQWRTIRQIDGATDEAVALAVERGWLQVDESGEVALTEHGRKLAQELGRLLY